VKDRGPEIGDHGKQGTCLGRHRIRFSVFSEVGNVTEHPKRVHEAKDGTLWGGQTAPVGGGDPLGRKCPCFGGERPANSRGFGEKKKSEKGSPFLKNRNRGGAWGAEDLCGNRP